MQFRKLLCPICGKYLLDVSDNASGNIRPFCKGCKAPINIKLGGERTNGKS